MNNAPAFLVEDGEGRLHGYFTEQILRADLAIHRRDGDPARRVFKLASTLTVTYEPVDEGNEGEHCAECGNTPETGACHFCRTN